MSFKPNQPRPPGSGSKKGSTYVTKKSLLENLWSRGVSPANEICKYLADPAISKSLKMKVSLELLKLCTPRQIEQKVDANVSNPASIEELKRLSSEIARLKIEGNPPDNILPLERKS